MTEVELGRMDLGRNQYVVSLELGIFQGRPKSIRPNSETVKIRPMAQEADSTHFRSPSKGYPSFFLYFATEWMLKNLSVTPFSFLHCEILQNNIFRLEVRFSQSQEAISEFCLLLHRNGVFSCNFSNFFSSKPPQFLLETKRGTFLIEPFD